MKQEKVVLSFIMVLIGLLVAGAAFYFYQSGKQTNPNQQTITSPSPSTIATKNSLPLELTSPKNESVVSNKTIKLSGKTDPGATIIIITNSDQQILKPEPSGEFDTTITLNKDQNLITVISMLNSGEFKQIQNTVTYSTNNF